MAEGGELAEVGVVGAAGVIGQCGVAVAVTQLPQGLDGSLPAGVDAGGGGQLPKPGGRLVVAVAGGVGGVQYSPFPEV